MSKGAGRRLDYDLLRVACMLGVVYLHTAADPLRLAEGNLWHFANLASSLATAAVPLFFMLSGALLLSEEKTADLSYLFRVRLPKILVPLLAWSAVVVAATLHREGPAEALSILNALPSTPAVVPYWFVYALLPMYLISPLLKKMADGLDSRHWDYLTALWFALTLGMNTLHDFLPIGSAVRTFCTIHWTLNLNMVGGYLGYFLLGARLARVKRTPPRPLLWGGAAAAYAVIALGTWQGTRAAGAYVESFKSYLHLFAAVLAAALFLLLRSYAGERRSNRALALLSGMSFGIYLFHPLAIAFWQKEHPLFQGWELAGLGWHLAFFGVVLLSCLTVVFLLYSVKPLCYLFTGQPFSAACRDGNLVSLLRGGGSKER